MAAWAYHVVAIVAKYELARVHFPFNVCHQCHGRGNKSPAVEHWSVQSDLSRCPSISIMRSTTMMTTQYDLHSQLYLSSSRRQGYPLTSYSENGRLGEHQRLLHSFLCSAPTDLVFCCCYHRDFQSLVHSRSTVEATSDTASDKSGRCCWRAKMMQSEEVKCLACLGRGRLVCQTLTPASIFFRHVITAACSFRAL